MGGSRVRVVCASKCKLVWHRALKDYVGVFQNKRFLPGFLLNDVDRAQQFLNGNPLLAVKAEGKTFHVYGGLVSMMLLTNIGEHALEKLTVLILEADSVSEDKARSVFAANLLASKMVGGNLKKANYKCPKRTSLQKMLSGKRECFLGDLEDDQLKNDLTACGLLDPAEHSANEPSILDKIIQTVSTKT